MRDTGIADRLRAAGLKVQEVDGWRTRGSVTFNPQGLVYHHTAGPRSGNAPSLNLCINGRGRPGDPDYLPGPLCHVLIGRDNTCYVIAAGRANHAGRGGWRGLSGNISVYGIEHENVGTSAEPWRPDQLAVAATAARAMIVRKPVDLVCLHKEWAPTRKIDPHTITGSQFRSMVHGASPVSLPPEDEHMSAADVAKLSAQIDRAVQTLGTGVSNAHYTASEFPWVDEIKGKGIADVYDKVHTDTWSELKNTNDRIAELSAKVDAILAKL